MEDVSASNHLNVRKVDDPDGLREVLEALNDAGLSHTVSGITVHATPFLACLAGAYAETIEVIFVSPWDSEIDHRTGQLCEECGAANLNTPADLAYPVIILGTLETERAYREHTSQSLTD